MSIFDTMKISASGLQAQQTRMNTISANLANIETTQTPEGGPYRRKSVIFKTSPVVENFEKMLDRQTAEAGQGVKVSEIVSDGSPPKKIYDPAHPDADEEGYVSLPNINLMAEVTDMMSAVRSYEANVTALKSAKRMALKALEIGK